MSMVTVWLVTGLCYFIRNNRDGGSYSRALSDGEVKALGMDRNNLVACWRGGLVRRVTE